MKKLVTGPRHRRADRDRENPGPHDPHCYAPSHRRDPPARTDPHDRPAEDVRRRDRHLCLINRMASVSVRNIAASCVR